MKYVWQFESLEAWIVDRTKKGSLMRRDVVEFGREFFGLNRHESLNRLRKLVKSEHNNVVVEGGSVKQR